MDIQILNEENTKYSEMLELISKNIPKLELTSEEQRILLHLNHTFLRDECFKYILCALTALYAELAVQGKVHRLLETLTNLIVKIRCENDK
jgi:hypothetical protein